MTGVPFGGVQTAVSSVDVDVARPAQRSVSSGASFDDFGAPAEPVGLSGAADLSFVTCFSAVDRGEFFDGSAAPADSVLPAVSDFTGDSGFFDESDFFDVSDFFGDSGLFGFPVFCDAAVESGDFTSPLSRPRSSAFFAASLFGSSGVSLMRNPKVRVARWIRQRMSRTAAAGVRQVSCSGLPIIG
ncbi:MAG: hypothetical protein ACTIC1_08665 [Brevibacterium sp.]